MMRSRSCTGGSTTMSTWPDSSAAERVAAALMGVNTMLSTLPRGLSHQSAFFFSVVIVGAQSMSRLTGVPVYIAEVIQGMALMVMLIALLLTEYRIKAVRS